eukprot:4787474-Pleurochrysis_carterae.AAC.1
MRLEDEDAQLHRCLWVGHRITVGDAALHIEMVRHEAESPALYLIERMPITLLLDGHKLAILLHWH